jgi:hypothetical protein
VFGAWREEMKVSCFVEKEGGGDGGGLYIFRDFSLKGVKRGSVFFFLNFFNNIDKIF